MFNESLTTPFKIGVTLTPIQEEKIESQAQQILLDVTYKFIKAGVVVQFAMGTILLYLLYKQSNLQILIGWYCALIIFIVTSYNLQNLYERRDTSVDKPYFWRLALLIALAIDVIIWGSVGYFLMPKNITYQFIIICFLFIASAGFTQGNISDRCASTISISILLLPLTIWCLSQHNTLYSGLAAGIIFYAVFLFYVANIGYSSQRKSMQLGLINAALGEQLSAVNAQLEQANRSLDQQVKKRTLKLEETLKLVTHQATHDLLTDLPNQRLLEQYLVEAIETANRMGSVFAVAFFELNRTKVINDSLGHESGNLIIRAMANRLKAFQDQANLAISTTRYAITHAWGDVFVVLVTQLEAKETTLTIRNIFSILHEPFYLNGKSFNITASIGACLYPHDGTDTKSLLMNAEAAMFRAKKFGGNKFELYTAEINAHTLKQLELESGLHSALLQNELVLHYQPIVDIRLNKIVGMEALVRWQHPTLGLVPPIEFITIAEDTGLIVAMGEWILKSACQQTKYWHDQGFTTLKVSVNLAAKQLSQENIINTINNTLTETGLPATALELEFTETAILDEKIIPIAKKLKEMGINLALDDFGTGYSGLTYVRQFSIDRLKLDKSFIQDIGQNKESETIILTIIEMAKKLTMQTLAEGVETEAQLQFLLDHGCDLVQGYYFSRPIGITAFTNLLQQENTV